MLIYSNEDTVAVHLTRSCNLRCAHCYQREAQGGRGYAGDMMPERVFLAVDALKPANLVLYGGEPLLRPDLALALLDRYPDKGFILHSNGTLPSTPERRAVLERVDLIFLTVESFSFGRQPEERRLSRRSFRRMLRFLDDWKGKIRITHNLYPSGNDPVFSRVARRRGLPVHVYPVVTEAPGWVDNRSEELMSLELPVCDPPTVRPKLRVLEDGTITRDMRGVYNLCACNGWSEALRTIELPLGDTCRNCARRPVCPACSMFPHSVKDILERWPGRSAEGEPGFCQLARLRARAGRAQREKEEAA